ncbi:MAG: extracellular solute-binding protein [Treponema sp.]|jgi:putative spermidine/putrescine transport system substrate-binding protein|nr:extracellular solute-binding protein [Treponema sp.]
MKKSIAFLLVIMTAMSVFAAGTQNRGGGAKPEVNIWTSGSDNVRMIFEKLVDVFNKDPRYNQNFTMVLQHMASGGGTQTIESRVMAAYQSGQKNTTFDIVEVGDTQMSVFLTEGGPEMLLKYDPAKIPNFAGVTARPPIGQEYFVPYRGTTVVMAYNSDVVRNPPKTTRELTQWIKDHPGRFAYNSPDTGGAGSAFVSTAIYNFLAPESLLSNDPKWATQWDQGFAYLKEIHPYLYKSSGKVVYPNKNQGTLDLLTSKEIDMAPAWADQALTGVKTGGLPSSIKIYQIDPSFTGSLMSLCIPSFGRYPEEAHAFINFLLSPEAQNILLADMAAIPLIENSKLDAKEAASVKDLDVSNFRTISIGALDQEMKKLWNETIATLP